VTRDLIYHICPLRSNDLWLRNVEQLLARIEVFNGRRLVAIAVGSNDLLHDVDRVKRELKGHGIDYILVRNDRNLREVASFRPLLDVVGGDPNKDRAVFYAHTKGNSTYDNVEGATYWRNVMYHELLDKWQRCVELIQEGYAFVGTHQMIWGATQKCPYPSRLAHGQWMFAGTFWWFSAARVFSHPRWRIVPQDRYGAEAWPSGLFNPEECKSVWQPIAPDKLYGRDPYDPELYARMGACIADCELKHPSYQI